LPPRRSLLADHDPGRGATTPPRWAEVGPRRAGEVGWTFMELHGWVDAYLDHLRVERAMSPRTIEAYARDLAQLCAHAEGEGVDEPSGLTHHVVSTYLVSLGAEGLGARSAARHLSAVRGFARFLLQERVIEDDPCTLVDRPRIGRKLPKVLSIDE